MASNILVSVITVSYNSSKYIRETIESILAQQYINFEYIISDDCSTDDTWEIIKEYNDPRIKAVRTQKNIGEYANRNNGLNLANGEYVIFIDGDDIMYPHALTTFLGYAQQFRECALIIARDWDYRIKCPYKVSPADFFRFEYFDQSILGNFSKILFKTSVLKIETFPLHIRFGDTYMQLKIGKKYPALIIPDGLTWWRRRSGNATSSLLGNSKYYAGKTNFYLDLLDADCPLSEAEVKDAKINLYGIYLRLLFWLLVKGKFKEFRFLKNKVIIPNAYLKSFFIPRKSGLFIHLSGDNPLYSTPLSIKD